MYVAVSHIDSQVKCFCLQSEAHVDINEPVDKNAAHLLVDLCLPLHVVDMDVVFVLLSEAPLVNVVRVPGSAKARGNERGHLGLIPPEPARIDRLNPDLARALRTCIC